MQMIEMHDMVGQILDALIRLRMMPGIGRRFDAESVFAGHDTGLIVGVGTDTAESLNNQACVARIAALQNRFNAAPQRDAAPGIL